MSIPLPFFTQYECRNESLPVYASDRRGIITYEFNNFGYRNNIDYDETENNAGVYIGSSITSGIGIDWANSFASISSRTIGVNCYHFAQGCMMVDNQEILRMLTLVKNSNLKPKYYVIQFIGLDRRYDINTGKTTLESNTQKNIQLFEETFSKVEDLLKNDVWCFVGADGTNSLMPDTIKNHSNCVLWNFPIIDLAGVNNHPGPKWHRVVSAGISNFLSKKFS